MGDASGEMRRRTRSALSMATLVFLGVGPSYPITPSLVVPLVVPPGRCFPSRETWGQLVHGVGVLPYVFFASLTWCSFVFLIVPRTGRCRCRSEDRLGNYKWGPI